MTEEERKAIDRLTNMYWYVDEGRIEEDVKTTLNLIQKQQAEIEKKDKIINKTINEIELSKKY